MFLNKSHEYIYIYIYIPLFKPVRLLVTEDASGSKAGPALIDKAVLSSFTSIKICNREIFKDFNCRSWTKSKKKLIKKFGMPSLIQSTTYYILYRHISVVKYTNK